MCGKDAQGQRDYISLFVWVWRLAAPFSCESNNGVKGEKMGVVVWLHEEQSFTEDLHRLTAPCKAGWHEVRS